MKQSTIITQVQIWEVSFLKLLTFLSIIWDKSSFQSSKQLIIHTFALISVFKKIFLLIVHFLPVAYSFFMFLASLKMLALQDVKFLLIKIFSAFSSLKLSFFRFSQFAFYSVVAEAYNNWLRGTTGFLP